MPFSHRVTCHRSLAGAMRWQQSMKQCPPTITHSRCLRALLPAIQIECQGPTMLSQTPHTSSAATEPLASRHRPKSLGCSSKSPRSCCPRAYAEYQLTEFTCRILRASPHRTAKPTTSGPSFSVHSHAAWTPHCRQLCDGRYRRRLAAAERDRSRVSAARAAIEAIGLPEDLLRPKLE